MGIPEDPSGLEYYVNQKIEQMKSALQLGAGTPITFYELQTALVEYNHVYLTLIALQNEARIDWFKKKNELAVWSDTKYVQVKHREHIKEIPGTKWASASELNSMVKAENKDEYLALVNEVEEADHKYSFMNHLIEMWKSYQYILGTLSSNVRAEVSMARHPD